MFPAPCVSDDDRYAETKRKLSKALMLAHRDPLKQRVPEGVTPMETMILFVLQGSLAKGEQVQPSQLAHAARCTPSSLSQTLKSLEGKGLIERRRGEGGDFRSVSVLLTEAGNDVLAEAHRLHSEDITGLLDFLGEDDVNELLRILGRISDYRRGIEGEGE